jgi:hypothetical protein
MADAPMAAHVVQTTAWESRPLLLSPVGETEQIARPITRYEHRRTGIPDVPFGDA